MPFPKREFKRKQFAMSPPSPPLATPTVSKSQFDRDPDSQFLKSPPTAASALSIKSVLLYDWWLIKPNGKNKGLAIGGLASRGGQEVRVFTSADIAKRHDTSTLTTIDSITVTISGVINRSRTRSNGFPLKVCDYFLLGFPYNWKDYVNDCSFAGEKSVPKFSDFSIKNSYTLLPVDFDDLPVAKARDFLLSPFEDSERSIMAIEFCRKLSKVSIRNSETLLSANANNISSAETADTAMHDQTPQPPSNAKSRKKSRGEDGTPKPNNVVTSIRNLKTLLSSNAKNISSAETADIAMHDQTPQAPSNAKSHKKFRGEDGTPKANNVVTPKANSVVTSIRNSKMLLSSNAKNIFSVETADVAMHDQTPQAPSNAKSHKNFKGEEDSTQKANNVITPRIGVVTRSMSRLREQEATNKNCKT